MKNLVSLFIGILINSSILFGQDVDSNNIIFKVHIGTYKVIPDSVHSLIENEINPIREGQSCSIEKTALNHIEIGYFSCYHEAEKILNKLIERGYGGAFIIVFDREMRISISDAERRTKYRCE